MAQPLYKWVEFCRSPEALWGKMQSHWDWLGVHKDGQFVVGYPKVKRIRIAGGLTLRRRGAAEGRHGVRVETPEGPRPATWVADADEAREEFCKTIDKIETAGRERPQLFRVKLIIDGHVAEQQYVVTRPQTTR